MIWIVVAWLWLLLLLCIQFSTVCQVSLRHLWTVDAIKLYQTQLTPLARCVVKTREPTLTLDPRFSPPLICGSVSTALETALARICSNPKRPQIANKCFNLMPHKERTNTKHPSKIWSSNLPRPNRSAWPDPSRNLPPLSSTPSSWYPLWGPVCRPASPFYRLHTRMKPVSNSFMQEATMS